VKSRSKKARVRAAVVVVLVISAGILAWYLRPVGPCTRALWMEPDDVIILYDGTRSDPFEGYQHDRGGIEAAGFNRVRLWSSMRTYDQLDPSDFEDTVAGSHGPQYTIDIHCGSQEQTIYAGADFLNPRASRMLSSLIDMAQD
jgi:hypothetical protein